MDTIHFSKFRGFLFESNVITVDGVFTTNYDLRRIETDIPNEFVTVLEIECEPVIGWQKPRKIVIVESDNSTIKFYNYKMFPVDKDGKTVEISIYNIVRPN